MLDTIQEQWTKFGRIGFNKPVLDRAVFKEMEEYIPYHIVSRHLKNAVYDYFKGLFPDVEIKHVSGANIV